MSGQEYYVKRLAVDLPLAAAETICDAAIKAGNEAGLLPLTVVVLDAGGHVVCSKREDGCGILRFEIARGKAHGALGMGIGSRVIRDRLKERPAFQSAIAAAAEGKFIPVPGGVLICRADGVVIGAVGVSGDASDKDEYAAIAGVRAARMVPHPDAPVENWQDAGL
jgi:uncharacterized protein GlcG (DUF336 family)